MATQPKGFNAKNAMIDLKNNKIIETDKDGDTKVYFLDRVLKDLDLVEGLDIKMLANAEIQPDDTEY